MEESSPSLLWTIATPVSAVSLAIGVMAVPLTTATIAYMAAPREIATFVDAIDSSVEENENFDCDVAKVPRLEDKIRLGRLLREIQKQVDDLREDLNGLVVEEGGTTLRTGARMLWASHRKQLEDRLRRLDMLRMRFLVSFMGIVAATAGERLKDAARSAPREEKVVPPTPPPPAPPLPMTPISPVSARSAPATARANPLEYTTPKKPMRRLTTQAMGYSEKTEQTHQASWFNVVAELQMSPMLRQRHASIEAALKSPPPLSPIGSPVSALRPRRGATPIRETIEL